MKTKLFRSINILIIYSIIISISFELREKQTFHPLKIKFDFSNIPIKDKKDMDIKTEFQLARNFISNLFYTNINKPISLSDDSMRFCDENIKKFKAVQYRYQKTDLLIFPYFIKKSNRQFTGVICSMHGLTFPYLAVIEINQKSAQKLYEKNIDLFRLKLLQAFTNIIGFDKSIFNKKMISNNYFKVPKYVTDKFYYSNSLKKYHNFTGISMPNIKVDENVRRSYSSNWESSTIFVPDYMKSRIDDTDSVTELTVNLLKELPFYRIAKCDFEYFMNKKCYRFDKKCLNYQDLYDNYFIEYHYAIKTNKLKNLNISNFNNVKCHLNSKFNLKNKQCGVIEGNTINQFIENNYCINYNLMPKKNIETHDDFYVPEFKDIPSQTLNLVTPSKLCPNKHPRTIFFKPLHFEPDNKDKKLDEQLLQSLKKHEEKERNKYKIEEITLTDKKYFVSFLTYTRYILIVQTLEGNGLIRSYLKDGNHNMLCVPPSKFDPKYLQKYQLFYKRLGQHLISSKSALHRNFRKMQKIFPNDYDYMTETYMYPEMKHELKQKFGKYKLTKGNIWLVKPKNSSEGRGIHIFKSLKEEEGGGSYLLTKYIENPHLINGRKYDFRIYVLITNVHPLSIYVYKQGLVRFASVKYTLNLNKLDNRYIHLTNTVVNKENDEYVFNESIDSEKGNKWSLHAYKKYCKRNNLSYDKIFDQIKDIVIKTLLSIEEALGEKIDSKNFFDGNYHNLFGFDLILDDDLKVHLLEVNDGPSLSLYDNMDRDIKTKLMADTFNLVGIVPFAHDETQKPLDEVYEYKNKVEEAVDHALCEYSRPKGKYTRVFPVKGKIEKYKKLFGYISEENEKLWEKMETMDI